jgi:hypothetical protein
MPVFTSGGVIFHKAVAKHHIGLDALLGEGGELYEYLEVPIPFLFCSVPRTVYDSCRPSPHGILASADLHSTPTWRGHAIARPRMLVATFPWADAVERGIVLDTSFPRRLRCMRDA